MYSTAIQGRIVYRNARKPAVKNKHSTVRISGIGISQDNTWERFPGVTHRESILEPDSQVGQSAKLDGISRSRYIRLMRALMYTREDTVR